MCTADHAPSSSHHLPSSFIFLSDSEPATPRGNIPMTLELSPKHHIVTTSVSWSLVLPLFETSFDRYGSQAAHHPQSQRASCTHSRLMPRNDRYFFGQMLTATGESRHCQMSLTRSSSCTTMLALLRAHWMILECSCRD